MTPKQAAEFLANAAARVIPIAQLEQFNAAIKALGELIDKAERPPEPQPEKKDGAA